MREGFQAEIAGYQTFPAEIGRADEQRVVIQKAIDSNFEHPAQIKTSDPAELELLVCEIEALPEYQSYRRQRIRYETFDEILKEFDHQAVGKKTERIQRTRDLLQSLAIDVQRGISDYYTTVTEIDHFERQHREERTREFVEARAQKDHLRRTIHNGLIASLTSFSRFCYREVPRRTGISLPPEKLFSSAELADRDFIGHWTYNTELGRRIEAVKKQVKKALRQKKSEPHH